ncbi:MAG: glycosyltransferase [Nitrospirae bacterium]|nr:glycosyltransferase [Nitrospirota bacterium]
MKIVMLTFDYSVDRRILLEAESLREAGMEVVIIASPMSNAGNEPAGLCEEKGIKRVGGDADPRDSDLLLKLYFRFLKRLFLKFPSLIPKMRAAYFTLKNIFDRRLGEDPFALLPHAWAFYEAAVREKADIYFAHDLPMLPIAHKAGKTAGAALVYDSHEFWTGLSELSGLEKKIYRKIESGLISDADIMITVNDLIAAEFFAAYGRRPEVLLNCVDWTASDERYNTLREKLGLPREKKVLLYQGQFIHYRNLEALVRSASGFNGDIVLVMLGFGILKDRLVKLAVERDLLNKKVFFPEPVSYAELRSYTASADAGIIPYQSVDTNTRLCTPNKLFEFISAGVPIIATDLPAIRKIVEGEGIGVVVPLEDENTIAKAVNETLSDTAKLDIYRRNLSLVHEKYSWKRQGDKLLGLISKLPAQKR